MIVFDYKFYLFKKEILREEEERKKRENVGMVKDKKACNSGIGRIFVPF